MFVLFLLYAYRHLAITFGGTYLVNHKTIKTNACLKYFGYAGLSIGLVVAYLDFLAFDDSHDIRHGVEENWITFVSFVLWEIVAIGQSLVVSLILQLHGIEVIRFILDYRMKKWDFVIGVAFYLTGFVDVIVFINSVDHLRSKIFHYLYIIFTQLFWFPLFELSFFLTCVVCMQIRNELESIQRLLSHSNIKAIRLARARFAKLRRRVAQLERKCGAITFVTIVNYIFSILICIYIAANRLMSADHSDLMFYYHACNTTLKLLIIFLYSDACHERSDKLTRSLNSLKLESINITKEAFYVFESCDDSVGLNTLGIKIRKTTLISVSVC